MSSLTKGLTDLLDMVKCFMIDLGISAPTDLRQRV